MSSSSEWQPADWERVHGIFNQLRDESAEARSRELSRETHGDIRQAILELLEQHDRAKTRPAVSPAPTIPPGFELVGGPQPGGMGVVFEARQLHPPRQVALKFLGSSLRSPSHRWRFEREIELLGRLQHPCIARLYEAGLSEGEHPWFAMEYVSGAKDLLSAVEERALDFEARVQLFIQLCDAVQHAHLRGVVHRDLKPSNILLDESGRPVLIDFGVGRLLDDEASDKTRAGELLGTVRSMSPEQLDGGDVDHRSDIFSLGVLLFELLSGRWPFETSSSHPLSLAESIRNAPPRKLENAVPSAFASDLDTILRKALEKDPQRRYTSAEALADDLRRLIEFRPIEARSASALYLLQTALRRHRLLALASLLVLASLVVGLSLALGGLQRARTSAKEAEQASARALVEQRSAEAHSRNSEMERTRALAERDRAQLVLDFLCRGLGASNPRNMGSDVTVLQFVEQVSLRARSTFASEPLVAARLLEATGRVYLSIGDFDRGRRDLQHSLGLRRSALEPGHPTLVQTLGFLADAEILLANFSRAQSLIEEALGEYLEHHPEEVEHAAVYADLLVSLGMAASNNNDLTTAEHALGEAIELKEAQGGSPSESLLAARNSLGVTYRRQGRLDEARVLFEELLDVQVERHPNPHPDVVIALLALSELERSHGDEQVAVDLGREALILAEDCYEADHPDYARTLHELGLALIVNGEYDEAEELLLRSIEILGAVSGDESALVEPSRAALRVLEVARKQAQAGTPPENK